MMKFTLVCIGKLKEKYLTEAVNEYVKRCGRFGELKIVELPERRTLEEEAEDVLKKCAGFVIVTDVQGETVSSEELAETINKAFLNGKSEVTFVIGSSEGLSEKVKKAAAKRISFGRMTFPHQLMRVIVCEQIYRVLTILNNVTYHK